ncbi:WD40-repeat-containing domain protein [Suillus subalutaceus]|uniref:WD40-repeat-containing domain protein n=1 Tax=Suillus subalutaceus TaxID=48586 RepID=UPI001B86DE0A|nr:WD40-repeat-containing domain protein [Suillus subalutaceus]KAG1860130.1 WD40-repeat-containing domain protein [Suillus subalutaceus]
MTSKSSAKLTFEETSTPAQGKGSAPKHKFEGHEETILGFVFLQDNVHIVSGSSDGTMRKWNCDTGLLVGEPWKRNGGGICALALSPDGKTIACGREDGSVQRWTTNGEMIEGVWTGHSKAVWSSSWSPSGSHIASGSRDGTILILNARSGKVKVGPIETKQGWVWSLAYSPSGDRIASGGDKKTICVWDTKTGELVVGPIEGLGNSVTSLVWSSDSTKLYSASDEFARVFNSTSGKLLHRFKFKHRNIDASDEFARAFNSTSRAWLPPNEFESHLDNTPELVYHHNILHSIALSPTHNVLACVGANGVAQLWDTGSHQQLGQPLHEDHRFTLRCVSFSPDGRYVAYGGYDKKLTLWMLKDIAPQLPAPALLQFLPPTLLQQSDRQSTQEETRSNSPLSSCLDADATGGGGFIDDAHDDPYNNNFFQSSQQSLPSPSPGIHVPSLFSARRLWNVISRRRPPDESVPRERSRRGFFGRRARSNSSLELATTIPNQPVPEGEGEQRETVDDRGSVHGSLSARNDEGRQRDDPLADARSPLSDDRTSTTHLHSKDHRTLWKRLLQARGKNSTSGSLHPSTRPANAPQQIVHNPWHWNSSSFPAGFFRRPVDVAACREEDRYGITPETDAEAAAAMLRTNDDVASSSTRPGQPAVVVHVSQGRPTQTQASTNGPEEIAVSCCGFVVSLSCRRSDSHQP